MKSRKTKNKQNLPKKKKPNVQKVIKRKTNNRSRPVIQPSSSKVSLVAEPVSTTYKIKRSANFPPTCVSFSERIGEVNASQTAFRLDSYIINPGNASTFPWLSQIAGSYEFYKFRRLSFRYQEACPTTRPGTLYLSFVWDFKTDDPEDVNALSMYGVNSSSVHVPNTINISGKEMSVERYVLSGDTASENTDPRLYFMGKLWVATKGVDSAIDVGELWVDYTVELRKPVKDINDVTTVETVKYDEAKFTAGSRIVKGISTTVEWVKWLYDWYGELSQFFVSDLREKGVPLPSDLEPTSSLATIRFDRLGTYFLLDFVADDVPFTQNEYDYFSWSPFPSKNGTYEELVRSAGATYVNTHLNMHINAIVHVTRLPFELNSSLSSRTMRYSRVFVLPVNDQLSHNSNSVQQNHMVQLLESKGKEKEKEKRKF